MSGLGRRAARFAVRLFPAVLGLLVLSIGPVLAQEKAQVFVTLEQGFGRLVIDFPARLDLPKYKVNYDNGVLAITFSDPVKLMMPDVAVALPDYVSIGRTDPDNRGVRFGLKTAVSIHSMEAGEKLFIDIMPGSWQGLPPSLPE